MANDKNVTCPDCGALVPIPDDIADGAEHWRKLKKYQARHKRQRRETNKNYCQAKTKKVS